MSGEKRDFEESSEDVVEDPSKKIKFGHDQVTIRCLVPNKIVGGLIGKGGENIKTIRSVCPEATIQVKETPDCPHAEERVVHVECKVDDIYAMFSQIIPKIFDGLTKNGFDNVKEPEMCLLFSSVDTGSIIGKRGATITNFRAMSGAFIKAFPNKLQNCDERVLLIRGDVDKIIKCISCIFTEVDMNTRQPHRQFNASDGTRFPRDPGSGGYQDSSDAYDSGYKVPSSGRRANNMGGSMPRSTMPMGTVGGHSWSQPPPPPNDPYSSHGYGQDKSADFSSYNMAQQFYPSQQHGMGGGHMDSGEGGLLAKFIVKYPFSTYAGADGETGAVREVTLENNLTGCVIGDRGSRIKEIRSSSGSRVKIGERDSAGAGERLISIEGTNVQCHLAEYMLQCCVQSFSGHMEFAAPKNQPQRKKLQPNYSQQLTEDAAPTGQW